MVEPHKAKAPCRVDSCCADGSVVLRWVGIVLMEKGQVGAGMRFANGNNSATAKLIRDFRKQEIGFVGLFAREMLRRLHLSVEIANRSDVVVEFAQEARPGQCGPEALYDGRKQW